MLLLWSYLLQKCMGIYVPSDFVCLMKTIKDDPHTIITCFLYHTNCPSVFDMGQRPHFFISKAWNLAMNGERLCMWLQRCKISRISLRLNCRNDANSISKISKHQPKACQFGLSPCDPGMGSESLWKQWRGESAKRMPAAQNAALVSSHSYQLTVTPLWLSCVCPYILYISQVDTWLYSVTFTGITTLTQKNKH